MTINEPAGAEAHDLSKFGYQLAVADLAFTNFPISDPVPVGSQFLTGAGLRPAEEFSLVAMLPSGDFEDVGLNQTFDLRAKGVEKFIAFKTDRLFRLNANGSELLWGLSAISGAILRVLTGAKPDQALYLDVPGGQDQLIPDDGVLDLTAPGVERVVLGPKPVPGFEVAVIYNGQVKPQRVTENEQMQIVFDRARAAFGNPPGNLILVNEAGTEINLAQTVKTAGVLPNARLLLRERVVQGG
jgi:hypothetical protein